MNGRPYSQKELKVMAGYVMQDDLMVATMSGVPLHNVRGPVPL